MYLTVWEMPLVQLGCGGIDGWFQGCGVVISRELWRCPGGKSNSIGTSPVRSELELYAFLDFRGD